MRNINNKIIKDAFKDALSFTNPQDLYLKGKLSNTKLCLQLI